VYWAMSAQECAQERRQRPRHHRRRANLALCQYVVERLQAHWSTETIEGRLELDFPADAHMRVSHEAIYRWMYPTQLLCSIVHDQASSSTPRWSRCWCALGYSFACMVRAG
jgi:IS30 family transposase